MYSRVPVKIATKFALRRPLKTANASRCHPSFVRFNIYSAHAVAITAAGHRGAAPLTARLKKCNGDFDGFATESAPVPSPPQNHGHSQQEKSKAVEERRSERFWPSNDVAKRTCCSRITNPSRRSAHGRSLGNCHTGCGRTALPTGRSPDPVW